MSLAAVPTSPPRAVLVVDDDVGIRETLAEMLHEEGYRVLTAANGREALNVLELNEPPGLILLDLTMPVMDGNTLLGVLDEHPRFAGIPVVVLSAVAHRAGPGATRVLSKPINFDSVLSVVREHCGPAHQAA